MTVMTEKKYSVAENPDMSFAKIPHEKGMTYEFDLRTEVNPLIENMFKKYHKVESLEANPNYTAPKRGKIFDFFLKNSGHVFFNLVVKKDGQEIGHRQVGFSVDKNPDPKKQDKILIGVPGFVFDQEKSDPSYHFNKTFQLSRDQFDNCVKFVEESIKNPPTYHWPVAMNCARFTKRAAKAAGIPNASLISIINLPETTQAYIGITKISEKITNVAKKINRIFSSKREAPHPEKKQDLASQIKKQAIFDAKYRSTRD